jgi:hypothetical protein
VYILYRDFQHTLTQIYRKKRFKIIEWYEWQFLSARKYIVTCYAIEDAVWVINSVLIVTQFKKFDWISQAQTKKSVVACSNIYACGGPFWKVNMNLLTKTVPEKNIYVSNRPNKRTTGLHLHNRL